MKNWQKMKAWILLAIVYFAVTCSFTLANFGALSTRQYVTNKKMDFTFQIYIQLSSIWDQSQLSSSIRLEMASKTKLGRLRDPDQFSRDLAERSTNFTAKLRVNNRTFKNTRDQVAQLSVCFCSPFLNELS